MSKHRRVRGGAPLDDPEFVRALEEFGGGGVSSRRQWEHKARQLCRQVQRVLNLALAGRASSAVLDDVFVDAVTPAPDSRHLLVHVVVPTDRSLRELLAALREETPRLRAEVAGAIHRKRAPELSFVPAGRVGGDDV